MFTIDERLKGLPALKEQVVQVYQSLNSPHLAVPGRKAGPATAFVVGLRGPQGFAAFVYLYLSESGECAVYAPSNGAVPQERYEGEESEALGFTESMGFIMDNLNFRSRADEQDVLMKTLPVFQREPPAPVATALNALEAPPTPAAAPAQKSPTNRFVSPAVLGRLFGSFCLALALLPGCAHVSDKDREQSTLRSDLAVQNLVKNPQAAFKDVEESLAFNPENAEAWHLKALLFQHSFARPDDAMACYRKALEFKTPFPEARVNLGTLYVDQKRYDDAIREYQLALDDVSYRAPYIAQTNLGWVYFKQGNQKEALLHLKAAATLEPKYCLTRSFLGQLHEAAGDLPEACKQYGKYRENCPEAADAWKREGLCLAKEGNVAEAAKKLDTCVEKAKTEDAKDECAKLKEQLPK